jgi:tetratricopeptide (TPR) repeat protein
MRRRNQIAVAALVTLLLYACYSLFIAYALGLFSWEVSFARGLILYKANHLPQAEQAFRDANRLLIPSRVYDLPRILTLRRIGHICYEQGKYADAEASYRQMLAILDRKPHREDRMITSALLSLASACYRQEKLAEAERLYGRAIPIVEKRRMNSTTLAFALEGRSDCRFEQKRYKEAEALCKRSLMIERRAKASELDIAITRHRLALIYTDEKRYDEATPIYKEVLAVEEKAYGHESEKVARLKRELGRNYMKQKKYKEAEVLLRQSALTYAKRSPDGVGLWRTLYYLSVVCYLDKDYAGSADALKKALAMNGEFKINPRYNIMILEGLVKCSEKLGKSSDAEKYRKQLAALRQSKK